MAFLPSEPRWRLSHSNDGGKGSVVGSAFPVALVVNIVRVLVLGLLSLIDPDLGQVKYTRWLACSFGSRLVVVPRGG